MLHNLWAPNDLHAVFLAPFSSTPYFSAAFWPSLLYRKPTVQKEHNVDHVWSWLGLRYVALKTIGGKQQAKGSNGQWQIGRNGCTNRSKNNSVHSLAKAPRQKALVVRLINWRADKTQDSCRYVRVANTTAAAIAAAAVFGVLVEQRKAKVRTTNKSVA